jgi:uncharacterized damage-inducible protein DinB
MSTPLESRTDLLAALRRDRDRSIALLSRLSQEDLQRPFTPEGWSVKDFLAHMAHWKNATHAAIVAYVHDQPLPPTLPSGDAGNAEQYKIEAARSLQDILAYWESAHTHLQHIVQDELDDTRLAEEVPAPWSETAAYPICVLIAEMYEHDAEHFDLIEQHFPA